MASIAPLRAVRGISVWIPRGQALRRGVARVVPPEPRREPTKHADPDDRDEPTGHDRDRGGREGRDHAGLDVAERRPGGPDRHADALQTPAVPILDRSLDDRDPEDAAHHVTGPGDRQHEQDRKSTRLNSSHTVISYAVF